MFTKIFSNASDYQYQKCWLHLFQGHNVVKVFSADDVNQTLTLEDVSSLSLQDLFPGQEQQSIFQSMQ